MNKVYQKRATLLIIDGDENDIRQLSDILASKFDIIVARNGQEGMDVLRQNISRVSAVIMDSQLPINNKYEYLEKIKKDQILCAIPVIICLKGAGVEFEETWLDLGATDYIRKPFNARLIQERISYVIKLHETTSVLEALEHDELTGLLTRQAFIHHAQELINTAPQKSYCIVGFDVENFKLTNTQYGEERCDAFLAHITGRLISKLKTGLAGRFGGDQFVVLFEMSQAISADFIKSVVAKLQESAPIPHQILKVGIYQPIDTALPIVRCCDRAFLALREIKGVYGKDIIFYEDRIQYQLMEEQRIIEGMEKALAEEQFKVFYQPKHETVTGKIAGAEALIRWEHPEYGFMSPGQFIPVFEKNGFITKIDTFVLKKVCDDILNWKNLGIPVIPISVNISRRDFFESGWIDSQLKMIDDHGLDHSLIHMEVTESMYTDSVDFIIEQVKKVQDQGYAIEMDDFGAGYSSLGMLATFPLNILKLDISFVRHISVNEIVIENIIKMAHRMGFVTVAEGAETKEEYKILKELGCDLIQGYVFSKPLSSQEFVKYLRHNVTTFVSPKKHLSMANEGEYNDSLLAAANEVAEGMPGGFFSYHADGHHEIIAFNKELLNIYECETAEEFRALTGNSFDGMIYEEDRQRVLAEIDEQITADNNIDYVEYRIKCKNEKIKFIQDYGRFVHTEKFGNIFYVFINDCTEEHEKQLEEEKKNEVIQGISQSYSSIFLLDFDTKIMKPYSLRDKLSNERFNVLPKNEDYEQVAEIYMQRFVMEEDIEAMRKATSIENIKEELSKTDFFSFTFHQKDMIDGIELTEMSFRKLLDKNSQNRAVITFRPVKEGMVASESERNKILINQIEYHKLVEENYKIDLQKSVNSAQAANKAKIVFIENVTKNIVAPLTVIIDQLQIAKGNLDDKKLLTESIAKSQDAQEKLSFFINDAIKLLKIEDNSIQINEVPTDITGALDKTQYMIRNAAEEKSIKIETFYEVENPYIYQDVSNTAEVVCCVIFNAIKYTPKGGNVTFGLKQIPCENKNECVIEFICKDNGIGISKEFLPHVFEKFSREDNDINNAIPSSGSGLFIAKKLSEYMNGEIIINSEQGKGTEVIVRSVHRYADKNDINERGGFISGALSKE